MKKYRSAVGWILVSLAMMGVGRAQSPALRFLSYNIMNGMKLDPSEGKTVFAAWLKGLDPDVVALQEVQRFTQKSFEEFARQLGHPYAVMLKESGYPVALTSKYPIVNVEKVTDNMHHGYLRARIRGCDVIVVHLSPHKYWKRREEVNTILEVVRSQSINGKWVIMGDFNAESPLDAELYKDGRHVRFRADREKKYVQHENLVDGKLDFAVIQRVLDAGFVDTVWLRHGGGVSSQPTRRFIPEGEQGRRIDYIFVSENLRSSVTDSRVLRDEFTETYSDHLPIWLELKPADTR